MRGIILAGGFSTRLRPLTINLPKPMAPIVNQPMMEHVVRLCEKHGFRDLLAMLHYSPEVIKRHFESGKNWDVHMSYLRPELDLGTAGCVRFAAESDEHKDLLHEPFIVVSGDVITDIAFELGFTHLSRMASAYRAKFGEAPSATLRGMN